MHSTRSGLRELESLYELLPYFLRAGFTPFLPEFDSGVDFIAYREKRINEVHDLLIKVQLKSRWTIDRKYLGRSIAIAFKDSGWWYVIPHDNMVSVAETAGYTATGSWERGNYSIGSMNKALRDHSRAWRLNRSDSIDSTDCGQNEEVWQGLAKGQS